MERTVGRWDGMAHRGIQEADMGKLPLQAGKRRTLLVAAFRSWLGQSAGWKREVQNMHVEVEKTGRGPNRKETACFMWPYVASHERAVVAYLDRQIRHHGKFVTYMPLPPFEISMATQATSRKSNRIPITTVSLLTFVHWFPH